MRMRLAERWCELPLHYLPATHLSSLKRVVDAERNLIKLSAEDMSKAYHYCFALKPYVHEAQVGHESLIAVGIPPVGCYFNNRCLWTFASSTQAGAFIAERLGLPPAEAKKKVQTGLKKGTVAYTYTWAYIHER